MNSIVPLSREQPYRILFKKKSQAFWSKEILFEFGTNCPLKNENDKVHNTHFHPRGHLLAESSNKKIKPFFFFNQYKELRF